jgi:hypothetical protein
VFQSVWTPGNDSGDLGFQYWHTSAFAGIDIGIRNIIWCFYDVNHHHTFQCCYLRVLSFDVLGSNSDVLRIQVLRSHPVWTGSMDRLTLKMKALWSFETSETIYQSIRRNTLWRTVMSRSTASLFVGSSDYSNANFTTFLPMPPHVPCGLRGLPSRLWPKCNQLLRLGRPWGAVTLSRRGGLWYMNMK